jgi:hypothetical protein
MPKHHLLTRGPGIFKQRSRDCYIGATHIQIYKNSNYLNQTNCEATSVCVPVQCTCTRNVRLCARAMHVHNKNCPGFFFLFSYKSTRSPPTSNLLELACNGQRE